ncbi:unnamed protein product [Ectocarpus sp. CCAP 1310/34]|nr:unnamed protein product [Ectocarpus sp. CCAP 1310/34]
MNRTPLPRVRPCTLVSFRPNSFVARFESGGCGGAGVAALVGCGGGGGGRPGGERGGVVAVDGGADDGATEIGDGAEDPVKIGGEAGCGGAVVAGAGGMYGGGRRGRRRDRRTPPHARHRHRCPCPAVDPHDVVGEGEATGVSAKNDGGRRRVVVGAVQVKAPRGLDVRLLRPLHAHHPLLGKGTTVRGGFRSKNALNGDIQPRLAFVAERLKQADAHSADASHRRCPLTPTLGTEERSTWPMARMWRRAAWPLFMARHMALSTTTFCLGVSGAVYSRRMPAASRNEMNAEPVNSPPLSMRKHPGVPMPFMSVRNRCTNFRVSLLARIPYPRCHRDTLSTNMIRYREPSSASEHGPVRSMWTWPNGTAVRVPRRGTGARLPFDSTQPTHGCISPTSRTPSCLAVSRIKNSFTWPVEAWNKLM